MGAYEKRIATEAKARDLEDKLFGGTATAREAKEEADRQAWLAHTREIGKQAAADYAARQAWEADYAARQAELTGQS